MENEFGKGAISTPKDKNIAMYSNIIGDTPNFDWNTGFDITKVTEDVRTKNQLSSGSCGGQAGSYLDHYLALLSFYNGNTTKKPLERSARYLYAPLAYPGGGSTDIGLMSRIENIGIASEELVPSNRIDGSTDEAFMTNTSDFDIKDHEDASYFKGKKRVYVDYTNIDSIAKAIANNGGIVLGIYGKDNGTWRTKFPLPPKISDTNLWGHWVYCGKAILINNKKYIGLKNSWGDETGINGWQYIGEEYLEYIFSGWGFTSLDTKIDIPFTKYIFNNDLYFGMENEEVNKLQETLKKLGHFPKDTKTTNFFGIITKSAVISYQKANNIFPQRGYFGPLTRLSINNNIGKTNMTKIEFRYDKFLTIAGSALLIYIATNLNTISWTKAGLVSAGVAIVQFVAQALVKEFTNNV